MQLRRRRDAVPKVQSFEPRRAAAAAKGIRAGQDIGRRELWMTDSLLMITKLSKADLTEIVLSELRSRNGCEDVSAVVIYESSQPLSNWQIGIVVAERGDPAIVQRTAAAVFKKLQALYAL